MQPPRQVFIYSYWLAAWAVLSIAHVIPLAPPTASLAPDANDGIETFAANIMSSEALVAPAEAAQETRTTTKSNQFQGDRKYAPGICDCGVKGV